MTLKKNEKMKYRLGDETLGSHVRDKKFTYSEQRSTLLTVCRLSDWCQILKGSLVTVQREAELQTRGIKQLLLCFSLKQEEDKS